MNTCWGIHLYKLATSCCHQLLSPPPPTHHKLKLKSVDTCVHFQAALFLAHWCGPKTFTFKFYMFCNKGVRELIRGIYAVLYQLKTEVKFHIVANKCLHHII